MNQSSIQWCDDTQNPVMGCDGCELWPTKNQILICLVNLIQRCSARERNQIRESVQAFVDQYTEPTEIWHDRSKLIQDLLEEFPVVLENELIRTIESLFRCYAGLLHTRWAGLSRHDILVKDRGYPPIFEVPTKFPGRMAKTAEGPDLRGTARPGKPWLNGLPRLVFVSDMGDALSSGIDFEYLKTEIVDIVTSSNGCCHLWLWLTKRPARIAEFSDWLRHNHQLQWPENLVAMTSITNRATRSRIDDLRKVPAKIRGLSVEPLVEPVELDLAGIDWLIVGGESGDYARSFDIEWARSLREQCCSSGTAFFVKQLGAKPVEEGFPVPISDSHGGDWDEWPADIRIREFPEKFHSSSNARNASTQSHGGDWDEWPADIRIREFPEKFHSSSNARNASTQSTSLLAGDA